MCLCVCVCVRFRFPVQRKFFTSHLHHIPAKMRFEKFIFYTILKDWVRAHSIVCICIMVSILKFIFNIRFSCVSCSPDRHPPLLRRAKYSKYFAAAIKWLCGKYATHSLISSIFSRSQYVRDYEIRFPYFFILFRIQTKIDIKCDWRREKHTNCSNSNVFVSTKRKKSWNF